MNGPDVLQDNVGRWRTRMGGFFPAEQRVMFRGHDLHAELKDMGWIELCVFGITGRRFTRAQLRLMEALYVLTSYPDPRIWNNRVAALAGTARSTGALGISAALAVSEAHIYGRGNEVQAITFFINTHTTLAAGGTLDDCIRQEMATYRRIAGYGRPLVNADERIAPTMTLAQSLGLADGPHVRLAFTVDQFMVDSGKNLRLNYGGLVSAFGADLGFTPAQFCLFMYPVFIGGMHPCYIEAVERPEGTLFPLPCEHVTYQGHEKRRWPIPTDPGRGESCSALPPTFD